MRERAVGESLWEAVLPDELRELPAELAKVDAILEDDRFLAPFRGRLTSRIGRPTIPIETYVRLMYLKHRYGLGYETLCREVADSFTWRRFCRVALAGRVPDPSTLMKLTKRLGPELVGELNGGLLALAVEARSCVLDACGSTARSSRPTFAARPIPAFARTPSPASPASPDGSRRRVSPALCACATAAARSASGCGRSRARAFAGARRFSRSIA